MRLRAEPRPSDAVKYSRCAGETACATHGTPVFRVVGQTVWFRLPRPLAGVSFTAFVRERWLGIRDGICETMYQVLNHKAPPVCAGLCPLSGPATRACGLADWLRAASEGGAALFRRI